MLIRWGIIFFVLLTRGALAAPLLHPEQAFVPSVEQISSRRVEVAFSIAPGYYLYKDRFKYSADVPLGAVRFPSGQVKQDPSFGKVTVYHRQLVFSIPLLADAPSHYVLNIVAQGCEEVRGVCFPPTTYVFDMPVGQLRDGAPGILKLGNVSPTASTTSTSEAEQALYGGNLPWVAALYFLAGLALAVTACLYPLIPIVVHSVVGQKPTSRWQGLWLVFIYVQGLSITYALAGVAAGGAGVQLQVWFQQVWVNLLFAAFLFVLALAMLGAYSLQLPSRWQNWVSNWSMRLPGGRVAPVFLMGVLSALLIGPCVSPVLGFALGFVAKTGNVLLGGFALYMLALGIGAPLLLVGWFGGQVLPRSGPWMEAIRTAVGVLLLVLVWWTVRWIIPGPVSLVALAAISAYAAYRVYPRKGEKAFVLMIGLRRVVFAVLVLLSVAWLLGAGSGSGSPLRPLDRLLGVAPTAATQETVVTDEAGFKRVLAEPRQKMLLVDVYADWCVSCLELQYYTLSNPAVEKMLTGMQRVRVDVTANTAEQRALLRELDLYGPPALLLYGKDNKHPPLDRVIGDISASALQARWKPLMAASR